MSLMPVKRQVAEQKTPLVERLGVEVPDWEEPVERLVQALEQDEFELYAQRIVALAKPKAAPMAEVLLRMRQAERMLLPPASFLPVFERCGMMPELDRWVMRRAIARLARAESFAQYLGPDAQRRGLPARGRHRALAAPRAARVHRLRSPGGGRPRAAQLGRAIRRGRPQDRLLPDHRRLRLQPGVARAAPGAEAELRQGGPRRDPQSEQPDGARQAGQDRARRQEARHRRDRRVRGKRRGACDAARGRRGFRAGLRHPRAGADRRGAEELV